MHYPTPLALLFTILFSHHLTAATPIQDQHNVVARQTPPTLRKVPYTAVFDAASMTPNILRNILNIVTVPPLGRFENLDYNGLTLVNAADAITGTRPQSGSNVLGWYAGSVALNGQPTIEAPGVPNAIGVGLKSLYFACIVPTFIPVITIPVPCTLSVKGYDDKDNIVASAAKTFDAAIVDPVTFAVRLTKPIQKFDLPENFSSKPLKRVTFGLEPPYSLIGVGLMDTLEEELYFVKG